METGGLSGVRGVEVAAQDIVKLVEHLADRSGDLLVLAGPA